MERLTVRGEPVTITKHAAARWQERCRPALTVEQAFEELRLIASAVGQWDDARPTWLNGEADPEADGATTWLYIGDDVAFAVAFSGGRNVATTCVAKGSISDDARRERQRNRRAGARVRRMPGFATQTSRNARGAGSRKRFGERTT